MFAVPEPLLHLGDLALMLEHIGRGGRVVELIASAPMTCARTCR